MSFFDTKSLKAKLSRLDQLEKANQQRLNKIQSCSKIKISKEQYHRYKEILFNYSTQKPRSMKPQSPPGVKSRENENTMNLPKQMESKNILDSLQKDIETPKNPYEFPVQMTSSGSGKSKGLGDYYFGQISGEKTVKAFESEGASEKKRYINSDSENVIVLEEMNPNLSFSSCPTPENRGQPLKGRFENYQSNREPIRIVENNNESPQFSSNKKKVIAYGGEIIEFSDSEEEEEESEIENRGYRRSDKKKNYKENKKKGVVEEEEREVKEAKEAAREARDHYSYRSDKDEDRIQKEFETLLDQKKALEDEILELRKMQEITEKSSPFKKKAQEKIPVPVPVVENKVEKLGAKKQSEIIRDSYLEFQKKWEMLEGLGSYQDSGEKEGRQVEERLMYGSVEEDEETVRTRRIREDEWRLRKEVLETKKKYDSPSGFRYNVRTERGYEDKVEGTKKGRERSGEKERERESPAGTRAGGEKKLSLKDLVDKIGAQIDEVKKNKLNDTPDFKKNVRSESEELPSWRSWGSGNIKELGSILEQSSDDNMESYRR